jgi:hypothetical protein
MSEKIIVQSLDAWCGRADEWGELVRALRADDQFRQAGIDLWALTTLRWPIQLAMHAIDEALTQRASLPIKRLREERVDAELDVEFEQLQALCFEWRRGPALVETCRRLAAEEPYRSAQRSIYHRLPGMRAAFHAVSAALTLSYGGARAPLETGACAS